MSNSDRIDNRVIATYDKVKLGYHTVTLSRGLNAICGSDCPHDSQLDRFTNRWTLDKHYISNNVNTLSCMTIILVYRYESTSGQAFGHMRKQQDTKVIGSTRFSSLLVFTGQRPSGKFESTSGFGIRIDANTARHFSDRFHTLYDAPRFRKRATKWKIRINLRASTPSQSQWRLKSWEWLWLRHGATTSGSGVIIDSPAT